MSNSHSHSLYQNTFRRGHNVWALSCVNATECRTLVELDRISYNHSRSEDGEEIIRWDFIILVNEEDANVSFIGRVKSVEFSENSVSYPYSIIAEWVEIDPEVCNESFDTEDPVMVTSPFWWKVIYRKAFSDY